MKGSWQGPVVGVALFAAITLWLSGLRETCEARRCAHGRPMLLRGLQCVCVEEPLP